MVAAKRAWWPPNAHRSSSIFNKIMILHSGQFCTEALPQDTKFYFQQNDDTAQPPPPT
jgi:hypothetical protein